MRKLFWFGLAVFVGWILSWAMYFLLAVGMSVLNRSLAIGFVAELATGFCSMWLLSRERTKLPTTLQVLGVCLGRALRWPTEIAVLHSKGGLSIPGAFGMVAYRLGWVGVGIFLFGGVAKWRSNRIEQSEG